MQSYCDVIKLILNRLDYTAGNLQIWTMLSDAIVKFDNTPEIDILFGDRASWWQFVHFKGVLFDDDTPMATAALRLYHRTTC